MSRNLCLVAILATATTLGAAVRAQENAARETPTETSQPQPQVPPQPRELTIEGGTLFAARDADPTSRILAARGDRTGVPS